MNSGGTDSRLGQRLVARGLVTAQQVDEALRAQRQVRGSVGYHLLRLGKITPQALSNFLDEEVASGALPAPRLPAEGRSVAQLPARLAQLYNAYPIAADGHRLCLALPPLHGDAVSAIAEATGCVIEPLILPAKLLREAVERDYLGAARAAVWHPAAGLTRFMLDDGEGTKPLAPGMRTDGTSPEVWLRSVLAEAMAQRTRRIDLAANEPLPAARARAAAVVALVEQLAGLPARGPARDRGRFQLGLRARRPVADVVRDGWESARLEVWLAEQRFVSSEIEDIFEGQDAAQEAVEALVADRKGLLLVVGACGGGARTVVHLLGARLAGLVPGASWIGEEAPAEFVTSCPGSDDDEVAGGLHEAMQSGAPLIVAEELPGTRSFERALLAASRAPVVAGFVAADAVAALAWLGRQGLTGALKIGLLRGIIGVLGADAACASCQAAAPLSETTARRWSISATSVAVNQGCPACLEPATRRTVPTVSFTPVAGQPDASFLVEDEERARRARADAGQDSLLASALAHEGVDAGSVLRLVQAAP